MGKGDGDSAGAQIPVALTRQGVTAVTQGCSDSQGEISEECLPSGLGSAITAHSPSQGPCLPSFTLPYSKEDFHLETQHFIYYGFSKIIYGLPFI